MATIPDWFEKAITDLRGKNIYGSPILRVVWAPEQRDWRGNYKYLWPDGKLMECFVLERWLPAGFFGSKDEWERTKSFFDDAKCEWVDLKGPFPSRGDYSMVSPILGDDGLFTPLDESVLVGIREKVLKDEEFASLDAVTRSHLIQEHYNEKQKATEYQTQKDFEGTREWFAKNWFDIDRNVRRGYSTNPR